MTTIYSGPTKGYTVSWAKPTDTCPDCEPDEYQAEQRDDGGTYITVRVPSQKFSVSLADQFALTITRPDVTS